MTTPTQATLSATISRPLQCKPLTLAESIESGVVTERVRIISKTVQIAACLMSLSAYAMCMGFIYAYSQRPDAKGYIAVGAVLITITVIAMLLQVAHFAYGWRQDARR